MAPNAPANHGCEHVVSAHAARSQDTMHRRRSGATRRGYTLLELLLSLALSAMVIYAVVWSVQLHLNSLDIRRTSIEEAQVGRALMRMISDDLRGALQHREQDYSGVEDVLANALSAAAEELAFEAGLLDPPSEAPTEDGGTPDVPDGGAGGGGEGGLGGAGGATGDAPVEDEMADEELPEEEVDLSYTEDIADSGLIPPVIGLYGNANQLQIDVSRVQRMDELYTATASTQAVAPASDIRTTSYYVRTPAISGVGGAPAAGYGNVAQRGAGLNGGPFDPFGATSGLVRRRVSRATAVYESGSGGSISGSFDGNQREEIVSPECVAIQFEYYDGFEWAPEWDSLLKGGLPFAVAVQLTLRSDNRTSDSVFDPEAEPELMVFRQIVPIPTAEPISPEEEEDMLEELQGAGEEATE